MTQSAFLRVIFHVKHKKNKLPFIVVLIWFLILGKIQDSGQDDDHCWWRQRPPEASPPTKYTSSCWEGQRLSTDGKIVSKYCNISKTLGRGSINIPPPPPCTTVGIWICAYVRGLKKRQLLYYKVCQLLLQIATEHTYLFNVSRFPHCILVKSRIPGILSQTPAVIWLLWNEKNLARTEGSCKVPNRVPFQDEYNA